MAYPYRQHQRSEDVEMGNTSSAMLENIVQSSNCTPLTARDPVKVSMSLPNSTC